MKLSKSNDEDQYPIIGSSVYYLQQVFLSEVKEYGLSYDDTIYEIEDSKSDQHGVIRQKGASLRCPRDHQLGASYVDCLSGEDYVGVANYMLSYVWAYKIGDIVDALVYFCESEKLESKRTYVWICCLCLNQHRIYDDKVRGIVTDLLESFKKCIQTIGTVLAMMSPWDEPVYLTRTWCVYEFFTAHKNGCHVKIVMSPREKKRMIKYICDHVEIRFETLAKTKIENANASEESDKTKIIKEVEENIGKTHLNEQVNEKLRKWIEGVLLETMEEKSSEILSLQSVLEHANFRDKVAAITYENENSSRAINIFKTTLNTRLQHLGADHEDTVATHMDIAAILSNEGLLDGTSSEIDKITGILSDESTFSIIRGSMLCNSGDFDGALSEYKEAEEKVKRILFLKHN